MPPRSLPSGIPVYLYNLSLHMIHGAATLRLHNSATYTVLQEPLSAQQNPLDTTWMLQQLQYFSPLIAKLCTEES